MKKLASSYIWPLLLLTITIISNAVTLIADLDENEMPIINNTEAITSDLDEHENPIRYDATQLWRIYNITGKKQISLSEVLEQKFGANIWRENANSLDVSIDKKNLAATNLFLEQHNFKTDILNSNIQNIFDNERMSVSNETIEEDGERFIRALTSGMDWKSYHSLEHIYAYLREVRNKHPNICSLIKIGRTVKGRPLWVLRISEKPAIYKKIWIDGGIHAREWISPATVTFIIQSLLTDWQNHPAYIKQKTWYIMPVVNPDGYVFSRKVNRLWRKNRAGNSGSQCVGVDLNRNFNIGWQAAGSSTNPCSEVYRGPAPASERETIAVSNFLKNHKTNLAAYLTFHSYSQVIVYPWSYKASTVKNAAELQRIGHLAAQRIREKTGKVYQTTVTHRVFGIAGGGSDDWARSALDTRFVYTVELRDRGLYGFALPPNQIIPTGREGLTVVYTVAQAI